MLSIKTEKPFVEFEVDGEKYKIQKLNYLKSSEAEMVWPYVQALDDASKKDDVPTMIDNINNLIDNLTELSGEVIGKLAMEQKTEIIQLIMPEEEKDGAKKKPTG